MSFFQKRSKKADTKKICLVQAQGANGAKLRYTGMTDVLRKTVQADGFKGLYRVSSVCILSSYVNWAMWVLIYTVLVESRVLFWSGADCMQKQGGMCYV